jgi:hypothetical protein
MGTRFYAGIDVQISRGCAWYVLDAQKQYVDSGWVRNQVPEFFRNLFMKLSVHHPDQIAIGIDAPRMPLAKPRARYYNKTDRSWTEKAKASIGRECEVVINSHRIANCQWTGMPQECPEWMKLGFEIFSALKSFPLVYEVFPSASYTMLQNESPGYEICLKGFKHGVKDMLDASVAALTVYEFMHGQGCEVGGGDGLGTIILPRRISYDF